MPHLITSTGRKSNRVHVLHRFGERNESSIGQSHPISKKKEEPEWMTEWRLDAFKVWKEMTEPEWANVHYKKPVLLDQVIKIESSINILKKASFYFYQKVILNSEVMCEANILCGCVDLKTKKPIPLPEDLRMKMLEKKNAN